MKAVVHDGVIIEGSSSQWHSLPWCVSPLTSWNPGTYNFLHNLRRFAAQQEETRIHI